METAHVRTDRGAPAEPVDIDDAIAQSAKRLRAIIDRHGPDAFALYVSGQLSLEAQYLANKLTKGFIGTNQIESNSRLCMASASSGDKLSPGADGPPGSYADFEKADVFFVIGANMADCHPILFLRMMDRVKAGAKLIVVDPRRTATAEEADLFLQISPARGVMRRKRRTPTAETSPSHHFPHRFGLEEEAWRGSATDPSSTRRRTAVPCSVPCAGVLTRGPTPRRRAPKSRGRGSP